MQDRNNYIGSSEIAAVMGLSRWCSPLKLWALKTGQIEPDEEKEYMEWGNRLEEVVARKFAEKHNVKLMAYKQRFYHSDYPYMGCELDRIIVNTDEIVEVKTVGAWKYKEYQDEQEIPIEFILQVNFALGLSKRKIGHIAILIGGNTYKERRLDFDQDLFNKEVEAAKNFYEVNIGQNVMPMAIMGDTDTMKLLYPEATAKAVPIENKEADELMRTIQFCKSVIKMNEKTQEEAEAKLMGVINIAEGIETTQYKALWKIQEQSRLDTERIKSDGIYDKYTVKKQIRVLRITEKKERQNAKETQAN